MGAARGLVFALPGLVVLFGWSLYPAQATIRHYTFIVSAYNMLPFSPYIA